MKEVVVVRGVRTAIEAFGGSLKDMSAVNLGSVVIKEARKRAEAQTIARQVGYIELARAPRFMPTFVEAMYIRPYTDKGG